MQGGTSLVDTVLSRTVLAHAVAGSVGGMVAMGICYPLDRVSLSVVEIYSFYLFIGQNPCSSRKGESVCVFVAIGNYS